jgi:hypothetical protein
MNEHCTKTRQFAASIWRMTPSSSFATRSASSRHLTMFFSPFFHWSVLVLIFRRSLYVFGKLH